MKIERTGEGTPVSSSREKVLSTSGVRAAGIDVGKVRVGVAVADELGLLAHPRAHLDGRDPRRALDALAALAETDKIELFVGGLPRSLGGDEVFVFSARVPNSFDSRYFGPVPTGSMTTRSGFWDGSSNRQQLRLPSKVWVS